MIIAEQPQNDTVFYGGSSKVSTTIDNPLTTGCPIGQSFFNKGVDGEPFSELDFNVDQGTSVVTDNNVFIVGQTSELPFGLIYGDTTSAECYTEIPINPTFGKPYGKISFIGSLVLRVEVVANVIKVYANNIQVHSVSITETAGYILLKVDTIANEYIVENSWGIDITGSFVYSTISESVRFVFGAPQATWQHNLKYIRYVGIGLPDQCTGEVADITYSLEKNGALTGDTIQSSPELTGTFPLVDLKESASYRVLVNDTVDFLESDIAVITVIPEKEEGVIVSKKGYGYGDVAPYGENGYKGDSENTIPFISNYGPRARALVVEQFEDSDKLLAMIDAFSVQVQEIENVYFDLKIKRYLSIAEGAQLDGIGDIVGERRKGKSDVDYRVALNFRIFINGSYGQMNTLVTFLSQSLSTNETFEVKENFPAAIDVIIKSSKPQFLSNGIFKSVDGLAAGGVGVNGFIEDISGNGKILRTVEISSDGSGDLVLPPLEDTGTVSEGPLGSYAPSADVAGKVVENILT